MFLKYIGAILIVAGCGGYGFYLAFSYKSELSALSGLKKVLNFMECELQYRLTALPLLCRQASAESTGILNNFFSDLSDELEKQVSPDVVSCMQVVIKRSAKIPPVTRQCLEMLGNSLGKFDLQGQLNGIESVKEYCRTKMTELSDHKDVRIRSYQTLSLCAGAALAILLI